MVNNRAEDEGIANVVVGLNLHETQLTRRPHKVWTQIPHCAPGVHVFSKRRSRTGEQMEMTRELQNQPGGKVRVSGT